MSTFTVAYVAYTSQKCQVTPSYAPFFLSFFFFFFGGGMFLLCWYCYLRLSCANMKIMWLRFVLNLFASKLSMLCIISERFASKFSVLVLKVHAHARPDSSGERNCPGKICWKSSVLNSRVGTAVLSQLSVVISLHKGWKGREAHESMRYGNKDKFPVNLKNGSVKNGYSCSVSLVLYERFPDSFREFLILIPAVCSALCVCVWVCVCVLKFCIKGFLILWQCELMFFFSSLY